MTSPGHRANILYTTFSQIGIGVAREPDGSIILTLDFVQPA